MYHNPSKSIDEKWSQKRSNQIPHRHQQVNIGTVCHSAQHTSGVYRGREIRLEDGGRCNDVAEKFKVEQLCKMSAEESR